MNVANPRKRQEGSAGLPTYRIAYTGCTEQEPHQIALFTIT